MRAFARLRAPDGTVHELVHGDILGRLWSAALPLDDGRVSEAHAMISLRERSLRLIALRGAFAVDGRPTAEVELRAGLTIQLARDLYVEVVDVSLPDEVLGLEGPDLPRQVLPPVTSVMLEPEPRLVRGWEDGAAAQVWSTGSGWSVREGEGQARLLRPGDTVAGLVAVAIPLSAAGQSPTRQRGGIDAPLHIVAQFDTVHIHRDGRPPVMLSGVLARLVSELVAMDGPVPWAVLARQVWRDEDDLSIVRPRLDVNLSRLRRKLREARIRTDLVRTDGAGSVELLPYPHDTVEDRT